MADELKITVAVDFANGGLKDKVASEQFIITQLALGMHAPVVTVGVAEEDLNTGDIAALGYVFMRNLDVTNYITYGPSSGGSMVPMGKLKAGEVAILRLESNIVLRWKANTAPVKVQVKLYND